MKFFNFQWGKPQLFYRTTAGERKTLNTPLPILVGVPDEAKEGDAYAVFHKYLGPWVSTTISDRDFNQIESYITANSATGGQSKLAKVIGAAQEELGSIKIQSIVAWHKPHDNDSDEHIPVVRLRILAHEADRVRVLNVRGDEYGNEDKDKGVIVDDPLDLAEAIADLF
jgi:hypothetical protein